ncbi:MAG: hypothetical protein LBM73_03320 [Candidatus Nomurabacteria bacterium]|jgi:hypothetical protein|nr:hypothetical protein [Candidatus Nomurabacteria bacterium]
MRSQTRLDEIVKKFKAFPADDGYDLIVLPELLRPFLTEIFAEGFNVTSVAWWEHLPDPNHPRPRLGMSGIKMPDVDGWFSEIAYYEPDTPDPARYPVGADPVLLPNGLVQERVERLMARLNAVKLFYNGTEYRITSRPTDQMVGGAAMLANGQIVPAFWLDTPDDWRNSAPKSWWIKADFSEFLGDDTVA